MYSIEICDYTNPTHLQAFVDLLAEYMGDPMGDHPAHSKLEQLRLVDRLSKHESAIVVLVCHNQEYIAMATCFELISTFKVKPYLYIHDFTVSSSYRNKGVGRAMMDEIVELAKQRGCCKVTLEVREDNPSAQKLYQNSGFEPTDPQMLFWTKTL